MPGQREEDLVEARLAEREVGYLDARAPKLADHLRRLIGVRAGGGERCGVGLEVHLAGKGAGEDGLGARALLGKDDSRVLGLVADRIEVPEELTAAVAGLLGGLLQCVVVESREAGVALLEDLRTSERGRAQVIAREPASTRGAADVPVAAGVLGRLADRVVVAESNHELVRALPPGQNEIRLFVAVGILGGFAGVLLSAPNGTGLIIGLAICAVGYDVVGFLVGSQFGRSKMSPRLSPNKTWEGLFGGMAASVVLGGIVSKGLSLAPWDGKLSHGLALGLVVAIMAPVGDLCESMIKRDLGVKDLGTILPGHGGILDRIDSWLFAAPVYYVFVLYMQ